MSKDLILKGLQQNAQILEDEGRTVVATDFPCIVSSFIADKFKAYFGTRINETTGRRERFSIIPEKDENNAPIKPEGADEIGTIRVVLIPLDNKGEEGKPVSGFILEHNVRGLPTGLNAVGMKARATGVEGVHKYDSPTGKAGTAGYWISGLDISSDNTAVMAYHAAKLGGLALVTR